MKKNTVIIIMMILFSFLVIPCYATEESTVVSSGDGKDSSNWLWDSFESKVKEFFQNLSDDFLNTSRDFLQETLFQEKDFTQKRELVSIWQRNIRMAWGILLVLFMIGVSAAPLRELLDLNLLSLREIGLRAVLSVVFVYFSLDAAGMMLNLSNGVTNWILDDPYKNSNIFTQQSDFSTLSSVFLFFAFSILALILAIIYSIRDCVIWYLIAYAPLFIILWVLPQTEKFAKYAANIFLGMILLKFIHAGLLNVFMKIQAEGSPDDVITSLGFLTLMYVVPGAILGLASMMNNSARIVTKSSKSVVNVFRKRK
jgi:hypothetical protein